MSACVDKVKCQDRMKANYIYNTFPAFAHTRRLNFIVIPILRESAQTLMCFDNGNCLALMPY